MKWLVSILFMTVSLQGFAEEIFPTNCKPFVIQGESTMLATTKASLVMIHNLSQTDLWVTHPVSEPGASAGWSSRLQPEHWSALVLTDKSFELSCIESKPGHEQQVSCANTLAICMFTPITLSDNGVNAPYWAGEDMPLSELIAYVERRGIKLNQHHGTRH